MKILFLTDDFPPNSFGGAGIVAYNLIKELKKQGHDIFIITTIQKKSGHEKIKFENLEIFQIYTKYHERWRAWISLYNPRTIFNVKKIIKEVQPDIIHAHNIHRYLSYYCLKIAKKYSKAVFLTAHDAMLIGCGKLISKNGNCIYKIRAHDLFREEKKRYNPFRNMIIKHYLKYTDKIFAVSNALKRALEINGIRNIETIYNGINIDEWMADQVKIKKFKENYNLQNEKVVLFGGRLSEAKGGEAILRAMVLVVNAVRDTILLIAGKKDQYAEKMIELAKNLGIDQNIKYTEGWLDRETMKCAFFVSDVCVTPSIYLDPFNLFNIEAATARKPVVGTCFGGTPEIVIDNETGYIVDPNNVELMAKKIIDLLKNPEKARKFGEAGYKRVGENFSLDEQTEETLKWYKKYV